MGDIFAFFPCGPDELFCVQGFNAINCAQFGMDRFGTGVISPFRFQMKTNNNSIGFKNRVSLQSVTSLVRCNLFVCDLITFAYRTVQKNANCQSLVGFLKDH